MYNIGVVLLGKSDKKAPIVSLKNEQLQICLADKDEVIKQTEKYDGIAVEEQCIQNIGAVCELIILLKRKYNTFVWIITERKHQMNRMAYLQLGADGILDVECDPEEYGFMMINALDRYKVTSLKEDKESDKAIELTDLQLRPCNFSVVIKGKEIHLTRLEYKTIEFLHAKQGTAVTYEDIYKNVWSDDSNDKQYRVSNLVFHIRKKIEEDTTRPRFIKTIRSKGYKLILQ